MLKFPKGHGTIRFETFYVFICINNMRCQYDRIKE